MEHYIFLTVKEENLPGIILLFFFQKSEVGPILTAGHLILWFQNLIVYPHMSLYGLRLMSAIFVASPNWAIKLLVNISTSVLCKVKCSEFVYKDHLRTYTVWSLYTGGLYVQVQ